MASEPHVLWIAGPYMPTYLHTKSLCLHTYLRAYIHAYTYGHTYTYIHTYLHAFIHTYIQKAQGITREIERVCACLFVFHVVRGRERGM